MPLLSGMMPSHRTAGSALLALTLLLARDSGTLASVFPKDIAPLNTVTSQNARGYPAFRGLASDNGSAPPGLDFQHMLRINQTLYIAARDHIYSFHLGLSPQEDLVPRRKVTWKTRASDVQNCALRGKRRDECHNFIRVLVPRNDQILFACGTNAFNPICRNYKMESLIQDGDELNGQARCPFDTRQTNIALFADGNLYSATMTDFLASDAVIYRSLGENPVLRTVKYDSKWLKEPHFVHAIEHGHYVYIFFREIAIEYTTLGRVVFSRVARVCKNDKGGSPRVLEKYWTSFLKARLNCSLSGESIFYFDVLQSVTGIVPINGRPAIIGVFTTQANSIPGSAICAFYLEDIQNTFDGRFKEQRSTDSMWMPVQDDQVPTPRPGCCAGHGAAESYKSTNEFPDESLSFIKSHPLLDEAVPLILDKPWLTRTAARSKLMHIVADTSAGPYQNYTVLFVGSQEGILLKILPRIHPEAPMDGLLLEEMDVYNPEKCSAKGEDKRILGLELDKDHHALFVGFSGCVIRVPLSHCESYGRCKRTCIDSRDPYCGWLKTGRCGTLHPGTRSSFEQDVEYGRTEHLGQCEDLAPSVRNSLHDLSNGVRKEADSLDTSGNIHVNFLIACTVSAFLFGAFLSGLVFSWYCSRAKRSGKGPEASMAHTISLPTLAKLSGLLDGQPMDSKMEAHPPRMYASLLVNCNTRMAHRDSRSQHPELAALPTPDSTPELPMKNVKPFRSQWERGHGGQGAKDFDPRVPTALHPCGPQGFHIPSAVVLPNNALGREPSLGRPAEPGDEKKAPGPEYGLPHLPGELPQKVVDVSTLDELLRHLHEMSVNSRAALTASEGTAPSGEESGRPAAAAAGRTQPRVPDLESAAYYTSATLPRDGRRPDPAPAAPPGPAASQCPAARPPPQRHSLSTFPKTNPSAPGLAKHHSFSQTRGLPLLPPDSAGPSSAVDRHHRGFHSRQPAYPGMGTVPRQGAQRGGSAKPNVPPKPPVSPGQSPTSPSSS
ncbi:sema domain, transmembrane domain (TM), and cytoplasmic domain, (semaphorin) 6C isoform X2 [Heterodontus francisci]|uniref:sema domain, transmembrane domain (TM), and cytoplasmic domain, (semaphorin) 6C isoform X2 n=1 Tax=Heterodontus francisci TaxID=7792 RepID=UPI00355ADE73